MKVENINDLITLLKEKQQEYSKIITADTFFSYLDNNFKKTLSKEEKEDTDKKIKELLSIPENVKNIVKETGLIAEDIYLYYLKEIREKYDKTLGNESVISFLSKTIDTNQFAPFEYLLTSTPEEEKALLERRKKMLDLFREEGTKSVLKKPN